MGRIAAPSMLRIGFVALALGLTWIALATSHTAHVRVCHAQGDYRGPRIRIACPSGIFAQDSGNMVWRRGPTIAMGVAGFGALAFALLAISPKQGQLLM